MARRISLAHLTVLSLAPPEMIETAHATGYDAVGLRLIAVTPTTPGYPLMSDPAMLRETKAALGRTGIAVNDIEFVRITPELDVRSLEPLLATGADLGARHLITAPYDEDLGRLADKLAAIADLAQPYRIMPLLEFFPWAFVPNFAGAKDLVAATRRDNVGILFDVLHFSRTGGSIQQLVSTPARLLPFVHLCDAPAAMPATMEAMLHTARCDRLPPGQGGLDLLPILSALPADCPLGIEVPMEVLTGEIGPQAVARRCRQATDRLLQTWAGMSADRA
ncbi:MAG TPA: sugar phosphate isomerase/epimerase [Beijerinckiaceae bacterium]|nr:sugar phosphate isomerase/epimerase [Beijerinckiaceae bacterium]